MTFTDLIIIYLACGAPFAVFRITRKPRSFADAAIIIVSFLFWPGFAASLLINLLTKGSIGLDMDSSDHLDRIRRDIEDIALSNAPSSSVFEFREVYHRFTGLLDALNVNESDKYSNELFDITGHRNISLASKCLARKNRRLMEFHKDQARRDFILIMSEFAENECIRENILDLTTDIAGLLRDPQLAGDLSYNQPTALGSRGSVPWSSIDKVEITAS